MQNYNSINDLDLQPMEHAKLLQSVSNTNSTRYVKISIPKLMSLSSNNSARDYTVRVDKSILVNAPETIKQIPNIVKASNYITAKIMDAAYRSPSYLDDKYGRIRLSAGQDIMCMIPNGNIKQIQVTDWSE